MDLGQQRDVSIVQSVDEIGLPQRPGPVQRPREDARHLFGELLVAGRRRERELADVVLEIEVGVVDPVGVVEPQRHRFQAPAKRGQQRQALGDERLQVVELEPARRPGARIEHGECADMTGLARALQREELRVETGQLAHTAAPPTSARRVPPTPTCWSRRE